jgi:prolipoprotein diacylglyceryl transferase
MFLSGFLIGFQLMKKMCEREKIPFAELEPLLTYVIVGTIIGARLGHCLFYDPVYYMAHPIEILEVWQGGLASHGGTVGVFAAIWLFNRKNPQYTLAWIFDRISMPVCLTAGFIRLGNLMNSEIIGKPTQKPWAFIFDRVDQFPRHPAQIYESLTYFALFFVLLFLYRKNPKPANWLFFGIIMVGIYSSRIVWEFFKENQEPFEAGMILNMGQILSIPFVILGLVLIVKALRSQRSSL